MLIDVLIAPIDAEVTGSGVYAICLLNTRANINSSDRLAFDLNKIIGKEAI